jgi:hypothetical protein
LYVGCGRETVPLDQHRPGCHFAGVEVLIQGFVKDNSKGHKAGSGEGIWRKMASKARVKPKKVTVNTITQDRVDRRDTLADKESGK